MTADPPPPTSLLGGAVVVVVECQSSGNSSGMDLCVPYQRGRAQPACRIIAIIQQIARFIR